jgi:gluconate 2-dehydrogenase gamma chain
MDIDRRTTLALLGAGVLGANLASAQHQAHALKTDAKAYKLQFFTTKENDLLDRVAEMILPADDHSPGAHEAKVSLYIDLVVANSPESKKQQWRERIDAFTREFDKLAGPEQAALLNRLAAAEKNPKSPAEHFFVDVKSATLFGYYTSQIGLVKELGYMGNAVLPGFPGCPTWADSEIK